MIKQEFLNKMHMERKSFIEDYIMKVMPEDGIQQVENPFETFNTNNAVVWIDPLDGTSDFVAGNLPAVTVLIGLSINGSSRIGIVHNPFSIED
jgi:fructose-1,6-bisphosphatase/inositol monophosphatase family enzyme